MKYVMRYAPWLALLALSGCTPLQSAGGRLTWLVLAPAALIAVFLYLLRHRKVGNGGGRGPRYPDYDERE